MDVETMTPALNDWQIQVDGLLMGAGTSYELVTLDGLDELPEIRSDDTARSTSHGEFTGDDFASGITVDVSIEIAGSQDLDYLDAIGAIRGTLVPSQLMSFWFKLPGRPLLHIDGRVRRARIPTDQQFEMGLAAVDFQIHSTDSFKYGATSTASTPFAAPAINAGLVFPLFAPDGVLDFGPIGDQGVVSVLNDGTASASPVFTVAGPGPGGGFTITDTTTGKRVTYLGSLPAGSSLVLDASNGSVVIDGTADRLGDTIVEAWPQIPKESTRSYLFEPIGTTSAAILTASVVSTYW